MHGFCMQHRVTECAPSAAIDNRPLACVSYRVETAFDGDHATGPIVDDEVPVRQLHAHLCELDLPL
jgi:hypothetical protein